MTMATQTSTIDSSATYPTMPEDASSLASSSHSTSTQQAANSTTRRSPGTKYAHVFATHASKRNSRLSQDAEEPPSFVGFRNLMVLVLSTQSTSSAHHEFPTLTQSQSCPTFG